MPETRKHERLPISLRVRFRSATLDEFVEKYAENISHGGLFIQSRSPMPVGTLIKFEFRLTDESKLISGVGRIVWARSEGDDEAPSGMGIKFIKVDPESRERITDIVEQRGGGDGVYEGEESAALSEPPLMPTVPPKGLASGSSPPPGYEVRHPDLHGLSDNESIHAPQRPEDASAGKPPRETRPSLAAALMNTEDSISVPSSRAESMPAGLAPDAASEEPHVPPFEPSVSEPPVSVSEPPSESAPAATSKHPAATSKHPAVTGETLDGIPESSVADAIESGRQAQEQAEQPVDPFARPTSKTGIAAIESALADSLDDEQDEAAPADQSSLLGTQDSAFGIGADDVSEGMDRPLSIPSEPASAPVKQSRLMPIMLAVALVALVAAMLFFWFNQNALSGNVGSEDGADSNAADSPKEVPAPAVVPAAAADAGSAAADSSVADAQAQSADADIPKDAKLIRTNFSSNVRGATFSYGSTSFDKQVELPEGVEVTITASAPGYKDTQLSFVAGPSNTRQRITLDPLPHVVKVSSDPPGATIVISGKKAESPAEIRFDRSPGAAFVVATLPGHLRQRVRLDAKAFTQNGEQMEQSVEVKLRPRPKPRPRPSGGDSSGSDSSGGDSSGGDSSGGDSSGGDSSGGSTGDVPDNPF